jgi:peptidyl-prolyl cis-trans isomerase SurA
MSISPKWPRRVIVSLAAILLFAAQVFVAAPAHAQEAQVLVTINDLPITTYDVSQRISLWKLVGGKPSSGDLKKQALNELIDDIAEIEEAKRRGIAATEDEIDKRMEGISQSLKTDTAGLKAKLKSQGIAVAAMRQYIAAQFAFHRLVRAEGDQTLKVSDADIKKRTAKYKAEIDANINKQIAKIEADPRRRPITVYQILDVSFPIVAAGGEITPQLVQSRAMEVGQFMARFKGCKSAKEAASGIFDVKIGKTFEADATKLPKELKAAFDSVKVGAALGPIRGEKALQVLGFCGVRTVTPPKIERPADIKYPTADQVRSNIEQERFAAVQDKYRGAWRKKLVIEYRDPSLNQ